MEITTLQEIKNEKISSLIVQSGEMMSMAYNPYSKFGVGAALLCTSGEVVTGCNVENVSFGLTICAERTALVKAVSEGHKEFQAIAISATSGSGVEFLVTPCGACRQFIVEFNPKLKVYLHDPKTSRVGITDMNYLLPGACLPDNLL